MNMGQKFEDLIFSLIFASVPILLFLGLIMVATSCFAAPTVDIALELDRTDDILADIEENLPDNPPHIIIEQLAVAYDMQTDARDAFDLGENMLALHMTMQSREVARRVQALLDAGPGQNAPGPPEPLLRLLEQNAELIEELAPTVDEFGNEVTRANFAQAVEMQNQAWDAFNEGNFPIAGNLAERARDKLFQIRHSLVSAERGLDSERVISELERASDLLNRADEKIPSPAKEAQALLNTARDMFAESEKLYNEGRPQEALRLLEEVFSLTQRAVRIASRRGPQSAEVVGIVSRTDELIEIAAEPVDESGRRDAEQMLDQAREIQRQAKAALDAGETAQAEKLTIEARRMTDLSVRTAKENDEIHYAEVDRALAHTEELIADFAPKIETSGSEPAIDLLHRAEKLQSDALAYRDSGKLKEALYTTRAAGETIQRGIRLAGIK